MFLLFFLLSSLVACQWAPTTTASAASGTFTNPVKSGNGADPFVVQVDGNYYLTYTTVSNIALLKSPVLT